MVRTRFAPSPTGALHVGNARIAVLNWLFTRREGGAFILRIEDTDQERNVAGAEEGIGHDLSWLGLDWDEGPGAGEYAARGAHGPYRQTERAALYTEYAQRLRAAGVLYPCFCSDELLEQDREAALKAGAPVHYTGRCRALPAADAAARIAAGEAYALRFRVPDGRTITVHDVVRGEVRVDSGEIGDFIVLRSDGQPTYNFAVVVDDITMEITHVIRGAGHLSNTHRQVLVFEALGHEPPVFAHVPTVLGPDRQKLSKRHGATSVAEYRAQGYHPDALVNYLSLLSWSSPSGEDVLTRERLIAEISLDRIGAADVVFDGTKLRWLSGRHIELMPLDALIAAVRPFLDDALVQRIADGTLDTAIAAVRTHLTTFAEINEHLGAFFPREPARAPADESARRVVAEALDVLRATEWQEQPLTDAVKRIAQAAGVKGRALYEPLRLALTGSEHGPPFVAVLRVQGREAVLARLQSALSA